MKVLWAKSPRTAAEVVHALAKPEDWHPNTIKTLLVRLQRKKAVKIDKSKSPQQFFAAVSEKEAVFAATEAFLNKVFDGQAKPLLMHYAAHHKLTREDMDEMQQLLNQKRRKSR